MFQTLRNAWKIEDLRKKLLFTVFIILIFRIGSAVTVPFVDVTALKEAVDRLRPAHLTVEVVPALALRGEVQQRAMLTGAVYLELDDQAS